MRVGLEREVVGGDVRHAERDRLAHVGERLLERLARQRVHEVGVHRREDRERGHGAPRLVGAVDAPDRGELRVVEALHAEREPVHARLAVAAEALALERARVRLHRDLGVGIHHEARAHRGEQAVDRRGREEARRAAADEDRVQPPPPHRGQARLEVGDERIDVLRFGKLAALLVGVEVAIGALAQAPRDVHVERQRRKLGELHGAFRRGRAVPSCRPPPAARARASTARGAPCWSSAPRRARGSR